MRNSGDIKLQRRPVQAATGVSGTVVLHSLGGLVALIVLGFGSVMLLRSTSTQASIADAVQQTKVMAIGIVQPELTDEVFTKSPAVIAKFDAITHKRLLPAGASRVKIWAANGEVLYSDEHRLIGNTFSLDASTADAFGSDQARASLSDLDEPENRYEQRDAELLEVYQRVIAPNGTAVLFEVYYPYAAVEKARDGYWDDYAPPVIGTLLALGAIEIALGVSLARRIRAAQSERELLLSRVVDASDAERQRIARDLHDGVVQDLAGVSFTIAGALEQLGVDADPHSRAALREAAATTRRGIRQLRTLLVDLYPPNLRGEGLESAIGDLLARAQSGGVSTSLDMDPLVVLDSQDEELAFRVTQEAMRNTLSHAQATRFEVTLCRNDKLVQLVLVDDGVGFDNAIHTSGAHFGLQLLRDAAARQGARLTIESAIGEGTTIMLEMGIKQ